MKKVSLLCYNILTTGGTEKVVMSMANELANRDIDVEIVYMRKGNKKIPKDTNLKIKFKKLKYEKSSKCIGDIRSYIKENKVDAIISFGRHINNTLMLARIGLKTETKFILTEHGNPRMAEDLATDKLKKLKIRLNNKISNNLYKYSDHIVAVSKSLGNILESDMNSNKIEVIYNPAIDESIYNKGLEKVNDKPYIERKSPIIVTVGRLSEVKNHELLIDAFKDIIKKIDANLVIVGDGELEEDIKSKIEKERLNDKIFMLGYKENPYPYIKNADVFVLSSRTEAFGLVLVEALALNTKVVSTDCEVGPREILQNGKYGILCNQNHEELSKSIIEALENNIIDDNKKNELEKYLDQFKVEYIVDRYLELI